MSKQIPPKSRLGRGLSSLMSMNSASSTGGATTPETSAGATAAEPAAARHIGVGISVMELPLGELVPNPHQPRRVFDETALKELADSLRTTGLIQPVVAKPTNGGGYELIAGERRWRAAKVAGLTTLPVILKNVDPIMQAQMALVENLQRQDLNPIERAHAYKALLDNLGLTHAELADRLGEERSVIGHHVRLLDLAPAVQDLLQAGQLTASHAKVLAGVAQHNEQTRLAKLTIEQGLNLRNLERLVANIPAESKEPAPVEPPSAHLADLEKALSRQLGMRIQVRTGAKKGKGRFVIHYANLDQFDEIMSKLGLSADE